MLAENLTRASSAPDIAIHENGMGALLQASVMRMIEWCAKQTQGAAFMARGLVVDTLSDINAQIAAYFPAYIDTLPVLDDISYVVAECAQNSGQRFQEISIEYIGNGKIPESARANLQSFVKWYSTDAVPGADASGHHKRLKPGWSGGAGSPIDMLKYLNLGTKKGFLLQVCSLDITDAKAQSMLADLPLVQAFGGDGAALAGVQAALVQGGAQAKAVQELGQRVAEIKTLQASLLKAPDSPTAPLTIAAIAGKVAQLAKLVDTPIANKGAATPPAAVTTATQKLVETVKTELQARQIAQAVTVLGQALPQAPATIAANHPAQPFARQTLAAITQLQAAATTAKLSVTDAIIQVLAKQAPAALAEPVRAIALQLTHPKFADAVIQTLPKAQATAVVTSLTAPVTQGLQAAAPLTLKADAPRLVAENIRHIAAAILPQPATALPAAQMPQPPSPMALATLQTAIKVLDSHTSAPPAAKAAALQSVAENLQALASVAAAPSIASPIQPPTQHVAPMRDAQPQPVAVSVIPPALKPALAVIAAQAEAAAQPVAPSGMAPFVAPPPLAKLAESVGVTYSPVTVKPVVQAAPQPAVLPPAAPIHATSTSAATPPVTIAIKNTPANTAIANDASRMPASKNPAGGKCAGCFNKNCGACAALTEAAVQKMTSAVSKDFSSRFDIKPKI